MSSAAERRAEAIERISRVRAEVEAKEAEKVAKAEAVKQRKRETKRRWAENNPEKAKALQAKKNAKKNERINARLASDPAYREERKAKRQEKYQESKDRLAAKRRARLEEVKAMRDKLIQLTTPTPTEVIMSAEQSGKARELTRIIYTGVDPGKSGAIASLDQDGTILKVSRFNQADTEGRIALIIGDHFGELEDCIHAATIERVGAMPKQGLSSTFTFGRVYGEAWAGLVLSKARVSSVAPSTWQSDMRLPKKSEYSAHKRAIKAEAETRWSQTFTLDQVDAIWIAEWARLMGPWSRGMHAGG
jgi:flagellar biosynthesis GTPase FlhF